ncbi:MAG: efflux RND transporter periplasmic adaptor subunit [Pseudomonadota bacterium]
MRSKHHRGRLIAIAALAALALAGCGKDEPPPRKSALTVTAVTATPRTLPRRVEVSGTITAWNEVVVAAETGGLTAVQVLVDEGAWVRQGQLLVKINDALLLAQQKQQDAAVESARATLAEAEAALARAQELKDRGFLSQAALDQRIAAQRTASANLAAALAARGEMQTRLAQTSLRAPVSGLIVSRNVVKGQIVAPGVELFRLVRDGRLELSAEVPEAQLLQVRAGAPATVTGDAGAVAAGRVRVVTPQVDPRTRVGLARIALAAPGGFRPGMFARGSIDVGDQPGLVVPQAAVVYREGKAGVFVIDAGGRARFRAVATGARVGTEVEATGGLRPGERVAVQGAGFLADGDRVAVVAAPAARR